MISSTIEGNVAEIVLNAPDKLNSLNEDAIAELSEAYDAAAAARSSANSSTRSRRRWSRWTS